MTDPEKHPLIKIFRIFLIVLIGGVGSILGYGLYSNYLEDVNAPHVTAKVSDKTVWHGHSACVITWDGQKRAVYQREPCVDDIGSEISVIIYPDRIIRGDLKN